MIKGMTYRINVGGVHIMDYKTNKMVTFFSEQRINVVERNENLLVVKVRGDDQLYAIAESDVLKCATSWTLL